MSSLEILKECIEFYEMCSQNSNAGCFGTAAYCLEEKLENGEDFKKIIEHELMNLKMLQPKFRTFDFDPIISKLESLKNA